MSETLFFRCIDVDAFEWLVFDGAGKHRHSGTGAEEDFLQALEPGFEGRAVFVVPGEDVLATSANIPSRQLRQIVQAVPYAVEEQLAVDVETCFFALGGRNKDDEILVSVVDRKCLEGWLELIAGLPFRITTIVAEHSLVPAGEEIRGQVDGGRVHIRWPGGTGMTAGVAELPLAIAVGEQSSALKLSGMDQSLPELELQVSEITAAGTEVELSGFNESGFYLLCSNLTGSETNLLQGEFRVEEAATGIQVVWKSVAVLAAIAMILHLALVVGQGWYLDTRAEEMQASARALYQEVFPDDRNVRDLRRRWNSHIGKSDKSGNEFIRLFSQASRGLPTAGLSLGNVNFNEGRGDLVLQVTGERSEELVQYAQKLSGEGMDAEIGTISQEGESVRGSIRVRSERSDS